MIRGWRVVNVLEEGSRTMKAVVDADTCTGCEQCVDICPDVFEMSESGDVAVAKAAVVPAEAEDACREAAESCPVEAISIEE